MKEWDFSRKEDYERLTKYISNVLRRFSISESVEDFAQEYVLGVLEGKNRHQTIEQFVIDVLRKRSGRKGTSGYDQRLALVSARNIEDIQVSDRRAPQDNLDARIHSDRMRSFVKQREWHLYSEGYSLKEIGELTGVSQSRISQKLKVQKDIVEKYYFLEELNFNPEAKKWAIGNL